MPKIKVAACASGFDQKNVQDLLATCDVIFTTNSRAVPVLERLYPLKPIYMVRQDMGKEDILLVLQASRRFEFERITLDDIDRVSTLSLYEDAPVDQVDLDLNVAWMEYDKALKAVVELIRK